jgi:hypothetical protein
MPCKKIIVRKPEMIQALVGIGIQCRRQGMIKELKLLKVETWWNKAQDKII